jgi:hypothetical protein
LGVTGFTVTDSGGWSWFPWGVLRSAGFPIDWVESLHDDELVLAADTLIEADQDVGRAGREFLDHSTGMTNRTLRRRLQRAVSSERLIDMIGGTGNLESWIADWNAVLERRADAAGSFQRVYERECLDSAQRLLRVLEDDGIRRALLWQNRRVIPFLSKAKDSWDKRTLLKYVARYTTKNDTIGFFGPAAWIRMSEEPGSIQLLWGPAVTRATLLSFELWPIAVIGERLAEHENLRPWLSPRRSPLCRLQDQQVFMPPDCPIDVSRLQIDILRLCDGRHSAREIAEQLGCPISRILLRCTRTA